ncbi:hypothetical protein ROZALSC1DRAFT_26503 [Rozella allomycis CSF55]|uniref:Chloride channel protein n=1 Tax=Rozella allomycis (strain CSF55) TaxID=988480 RepID=A0A075B426_ROZAC|nr:Chloride channel, voltage gated domain-containing protein [Rozella allomycis CSF55]RKP22120.1 hypothetical protein ROZALSC1DRAFT_26503 [Rozella allomycis CSF55]|eukprot:EPZ35964.1 Chloride channel, voltage gated domain-containing protein [Rozella allomycis CSF55]
MESKKNECIKDDARIEKAPSIINEDINRSLNVIRDSVNDEDIISFRKKVKTNDNKWTKYFPMEKVYKKLGVTTDIRNEVNDEKEEEVGRRVAYDNFSTIDWLFDQTKAKQRKRDLKKVPGWKGKLLAIYDSSESWMITIIVGLAVALITTCISISIEWLSSIKNGFCRNGFHLNKKFCCLGDEELCEDWISWRNADGRDGGEAIDYIMYVFLSCLFAFIAAFFVKKLQPYAAGSGIPECKTIMGGFVIKGYLGLMSLVTKSISLIFAVAAGLCIGKEGPLVHIACCVGNIIPRFFPNHYYNEAKKREILSGATAAGLAVAFGAPIGGVLFSLEEVSYYFPHTTMLRSFICSLVAVSLLSLMNPFRTGKIILFNVAYTSDWYSFELFPFILIGVFGGLFGAFFVHVNIKYTAYRKKSPFFKSNQMLEVILLSAVTSLIAYFNPFLKYDSGEIIGILFDNCHKHFPVDICDRSNYGELAGMLIWALFFKIIMTTITFGSKIPAGSFVPPILIGACFGRIVGLAAQTIQEYFSYSPIFASCPVESQCVYPGVYALIGAAAFLGGVSRMVSKQFFLYINVSVAVIMFEITGAAAYILPIMITLIVAKSTADYFGKDGIAEAIIHLNRYPFIDQKEEYNHIIPASRVMTDYSNLTNFYSRGMTMSEITHLIEKKSFKGYPVVYTASDPTLIGYISKSDLLFALGEAKRLYNEDCECRFVKGESDTGPFIDLRKWMDHSPITICHKFQMGAVLEIFKKLGPKIVIVTRHGKLAGIITRKDVLRHLAFLHRFEVKEFKELTELVNDKSVLPINMRAII